MIKKWNVYFIYSLNFTNIYGENFTSYEEIETKLKTDKYIGVLFKFGTETCPPCKALDRGPLGDLNKMVDAKLPNGKKLLIINCDTSKDNLRKLTTKTHIALPNSIPAFFLFKYNPAKGNLLDLKYESLGYDMYNSKKWLENMTNIILENLK